MIDKNYHTHLKLCNHAVGMTSDYVSIALEEGYKELGISDHAPLPKYNVSDEQYKSLYLNENMSLEDFYRVYLNDINSDKIILKKGIETEYIDGFLDFYKELSKNLDYMILGQHFFKFEDKIIDTYNDLDNKLVIEYANSIKRALDTKLFKILAHPDLYLFNYCIFDEYALKACQIIMQACEQNDVLVEINCNGKNYGLVNGEYKYPRTEFFLEAKKYNVKFIIGVDAHNPEALREGFIKPIEDFCDKLGINYINKKEK